MNNKISYREFIKKTQKKVDSWFEVLIFDKLSNPISYILYLMFPGEMYAPYIITVSHFVLKIISAYLFLTGNWVVAPLLFIVATVLDSVDGKLSRIMYGKDPDSRGTLDFLLDSIAHPIMYMAIAINLMIKGNTLQSSIVISLLVSYAVFMAATSTKFRLYAIYDHNPNASLRKSGLSFSNSTIMNALFSMQRAAAKYRVPFYPSFIEAEIITLVIFPFFNSTPLLIAAFLITALDIVASGLLPIYLLIKKSNVKDR